MKIIDMAGNVTTADSPNRAIWWANCGYWTDDWDSLASSNGIPTCPECGCPGFNGTAEDFLGGSLDRYDSEHPGYKDFLLRSKNTCMKSSGGILNAFETSK